MTASQCTAVDDFRQEVTFNPTSPGDPTPVSIDGGAVLQSVACPSATQCTAVANDGNELTFDPTAPGHPSPFMIDSNGDVNGVACPTTTQCTAVDSFGYEVTFEPRRARGHNAGADQHRRPRARLRDVPGDQPVRRRRVRWTGGHV